MLSLVFAFIENENIDNWYCFLECVKVQVFGTQPDVCLISNKHLVILVVVLQLQRGLGTHVPLWPNVQSRWSVRYMITNFCAQFKNKDYELIQKVVRPKPGVKVQRSLESAR
jgi:hypothetical protein